MKLFKRMHLGADHKVALTPGEVTTMSEQRTINEKPREATYIHSSI